MSTTSPCQWGWMAEARDDGRLEDVARATFERHAAGCTTCRREIENAEWLRRQMDGLPMPGLSDFEHRRERDRLLGRAVRLRVDRGQRTSPRGLWLVGAAACAAALVVVGIRMTAHHLAEQRGAGQAAVPAAPAPDEPPHYEVTALANGVWSTEETGSTARITLARGSAAFHVHKLKPGQRFLVTLPDGEIEVRGTRFVVDLENGRTRYVVVMEGKVAFRRAGSPEVLLLGGQRWDAPAPAPGTTASTAGTTGAPPSLQPATAPARMAKVRRSRIHAKMTNHATRTGARPAASSSRVSEPDLTPAPPEPAATASDTAASASPASAQLARAVSAFRNGRYDDADALLRDFIARNPNDPRTEDATFLRIVGRTHSHDPEGAAEMARRYLAQFPNGLRRREAEQVLHPSR